MKKVIICILICSLLAGTVLCCAGCAGIDLKKKTEPDGKSAAIGDGSGEETEETGGTEAATDESGSLLPAAEGDGASAAAPTNADGVPVASDATTAPAANPGAADVPPSITVAASRSEGLKAGDTFDVTVGVKNASLLAVVTLNLQYDASCLHVERVKTTAIEDLVSVSSDTGSAVTFAAYTARTLELPSDTLFTVTFKVTKAPAGADAVGIKVGASSWEVGTDADGSSTVNIADKVAAVETAIRIDG